MLDHLLPSTPPAPPLRRSIRQALRLARDTAAFCAAPLCAALLTVACTSDSSRSGPVPTADHATAHPLDRHAAVTIYPSDVAGHALPQVAEALGMMLERGGMDHLDLASASFAPPADAGLEPTASAFAAFVKAAPPASEYALFNQFLGSPKSGVSAVRAILASRSGEVIWTDSQTSDDADFARLKPRDPLDCCRLTVTRLRPLFHLDDPFRKGAPEGRLAQLWRARTGLPTDAEAEAMGERAELCRAHARTSTLAVLRPRGPEGVSTSAGDLASRVGAATPFKVSAVDRTPALTRVVDINEQKVLWTMAREFSADLRRNPPDADYVLMTDYLIGVEGDGTMHVGAVHLVLCDRAGELVLVEHQNRRHADLQALAPRTVADCDALVVQRLQRFLK